MAQHKRHTSEHAEKLQPQERRSRHSSAEMAEQSALNKAQIDTVVATRRELFAAVERYITVKARERIRAKLTFEQQELTRMLSEQAQLRSAARRAIQVLNKAFFEQRPLDISLFD